MTKEMSFANGIISATILPFMPDNQIDEVSLRKLVEYNLSAPRINGIVCNAFAGETFSLNSEERSDVTRIVRDQVDGRVPVIAGIWAESLNDIKKEVETAQSDGADAILLFPPFTFGRGANLTPEIPVRFHEAIASYSSVPIIGFQTRVGTGTCYSSETMGELSKINKIIAIKNACFDMVKYEQDVKAIKDAGSQAEILTGCDTILAPTMQISDGALLGLASLTPHFLSSLMTEVKEGDLRKAYEIQESYYDLVSAIYKTPLMDIPARMKYGLVNLGVIESDIMRQPWNQLPKADAEEIANLISQIGLKEL